MDEKTELLRQIKEEVINLKGSPLALARVKNEVFPVIGEGNHDADIMFIGEAPGRNEAETGRPFCGAAGRVLDELLLSINVPRKDVYITNIVKDRPPLNRDPEPEEINVYAPFLDRQVAVIKPKAIATLGRFSMAYVMEKFGLLAELKTISVIHGKTFVAEAPYGKMSIIPLYHPAVAIYNGNMKKTLIEDFKVLLLFISQKK